MQTPLQARTIWSSWYAQAQAAPLLSAGLLLVLLVVLGLVIASGYNAIYGANQANLHYALLAARLALRPRHWVRCWRLRCGKSRNGPRT